MIKTKSFWAVIRILLFQLLAIAIVSCGSSDSKSKVESPKPQPPTEIKEEIKPKEIWPKRGKIKEYFTAYGEENLETQVKLKTRLGDIVIELFDDTPLHRANFIHHIKRGLYEKTIFYRVIPDFMIQGGNSDNDETTERRDGVESYYIPSEVNPNHIHKRGALAMAMNYHNNPENKSSQYDFYIVIGKTFNNAEIDATEEEYGYKHPAKSRGIYQSIGGTPHLDGKHTVFGRVIEGLEIVEKIAGVKRDSGDWPNTDVVIDYEILQ
ncbi:peptidylprolyl isomerase [Salibacteraceae bacterium]|nr:peptidylprolyl isomerase [Salibacteraceae bacterium]